MQYLYQHIGIGLPNLPFNHALAMTIISRLSAVAVQTIFLECVSTARLLFKDFHSRMQGIFCIVPERDADVPNAINSPVEYWFRYYDSVWT